MYSMVTPTLLYVVYFSVFHASVVKGILHLFFRVGMDSVDGMTVNQVEIHDLEVVSQKVKEVAVLGGEEGEVEEGEASARIIRKSIQAEMEALVVSVYKFQCSLIHISVVCIRLHFFLEG